MKLLSISFVCFHRVAADLAYSNLGGLGPDTSSPTSIRYANVGGAFLEGVGALRFDLEVTALSTYAANDPAKNGLNGRFAQISFAANSQREP